MVFNSSMAEQHKDWDIVKALGGPKQVADLLHLSGPGRVQRVQNWKTRGIPSAVRLQMLERPDLAAKVRAVEAGGESEGVAGDGA
jgi:hypothetical protein